MLFTSIIFLFYFFPLFFFCYFISPNKFKNYFALLGSIFFYIWGGSNFIIILLISCFIDYFLSKKIDKSKKYLAIGLLLNIFLLGYFKYMNFFVDNINILLSAYNINQLNWTKIFAPLGISFLTFQKISYLIDIHRKEVDVPKHFSDYLLFIFCFPKIISGPITKFKEIYPQILNRKNEINIDNIFLGLFRFIIGLSKKVLIANVLGKNADIIFSSDISNISTSLAWFGIICYTLQIYFDFSAYTDMAIGLAKMMGFNFPENFDFPYISQSITEFWRRWHITLGTWMKDYLYIPLGGNRKGKNRTLINLFTVFVFSGIWHGANWTFLVWGIYNGIFLILERLFLLKWFEKIGKTLSIILTFILINIGWVIFRSNTLLSAFLFLKKMFTFNSFVINAESYSLLARLDLDYRFIFIFILSIIFSFIGAFKFSTVFSNLITKNQTKLYITFLQVLIMILLLFLSIGEIISVGFIPFIYFRF